MAAKAVPTTDFEIMGDDIAQDPWPYLAELRAAGPVVWHKRLQRWLVTTDREIRKILSDHRRFTVRGTAIVELFGADAFIAKDERRAHDALRNIWASHFRKPQLDQLIADVEAIIDQVIEPVSARLREGEQVDLADELCRPIPTMVIAAMMGVSDDMLADVVRWSDEMASGGAPYVSEEELHVRRERSEDAKRALADYLVDQLNHRRKHPASDLVSALVNAEGARGMSDEQLVQNLRQLLFAGNETTARWLANIIVVLGEHPDVRRELVADRTLMAAANDEVVRWQPVIGTVPRRVQGGPVEIGGVMLSEGDNVTMLMSSGNRDAARFERPDEFDIHRKRVPHLGFGVGLHNCLGSLLAKAEAELVIGAFLDRFPVYEIAAPYRYTALPVRGPLPVIVTASSR